nr:unnamed protein product [Naegleria fowleri]
MLKNDEIILPPIRTSSGSFFNHPFIDTLVLSSTNNSHHHHRHSTGHHILPTCPFFNNIPSGNDNQGTTEFCVDVMFLRILGGLDLYYFITLIPNLLFILFLLFKLKITVKILKKTDSLLLPALYSFVWCVCVVHMITCLSTIVVAIVGENIFDIEMADSVHHFVMNSSFSSNSHPNSTGPRTLISAKYIPSYELDVATKICLSILHFLMEFIELCVVVYMMHHFSPKKLMASLSNQKVLVRSAIIAGFVSILDNAAAISVMFIFPYYHELGFPSIMTTSVLESALQDTIVSGLFMTMYGVILVLPCLRFMRDRVPQRKSFYVYIMFLMTLHAIACTGNVLLLTCQSVGICLTMSSRVLYYALFGPVLYFTFLHSNLNRSVYDQIIMEQANNHQEDNGSLVRVPSRNTIINIDRVFDEDEEERMKTLLSNVKKNKRRFRNQASTSRLGDDYGDIIEHHEDDDDFLHTSNSIHDHDNFRYQGSIQ